MSLLLIDLGNSAIHWAVKTPGQTLSAMQTNVYRDQNIDAILTTHWSALKSISKVAIVSVAKEAINQSVQHWLQQHWQIVPQFIHAEAIGHGIQCAYDDPMRLGADRWTAMVAAFHKSNQNCCVLDCGTAVTFDVVSAEGKHLGGWIMPGYQLFCQSLSKNTAAIDLSESKSIHNAVLGHDTAECVDIAWHQGIRSLVQSTLQTVGDADVSCFLTGGDAQKVHTLLAGEWCYVNDLVLQGLAIIATQDQE